MPRTLLMVLFGICIALCCIVATLLMLGVLE